MCQSKKEYNDYLSEKAEPILEKWLNRIKSEDLLSPAAVYGYFPCGRIDNSIQIFDFNHSSLIGSFELPRQKSGNRYCISDFYSPIVDEKPEDYLPMQAVTMGDVASKYALQLFNNNNYADYLYFHGLAVQ